METPPHPSPMFDDLGTWLMDRAITEGTTEEIVDGFCQRLVSAGVQLKRLACGVVVLHPVFGALNMVWEDGKVSGTMVPRTFATEPGFRTSPFFWIINNKVPFKRFKLGDGPVEPELGMFERLRGEGITDYLLFFESYGRSLSAEWAGLPPGTEGVTLSLSTDRISGFTDFEVDYLRALMRPFTLAIKSATNDLLAHELLDTYLGDYSGDRVLNGVVQRGDGQLIDCVLFYCDLRNSTKLAEQLPLDQYLALINDYFDCTAGAVIDQGGEVLKFIGDAVMAIFPIDRDRSAVDMCRAAATAAREAFARADRTNAAGGGAPGIEFGVALHRGAVMYGNVGIDRRLDFTVIGPTVNQATRLEGLCKALGTPLVASASFAEAYAGELASLGDHRLAGLDNPMSVFTFPDLAPA